MCYSGTLTLRAWKKNCREERIFLLVKKTEAQRYIKNAVIKKLASMAPAQPGELKITKLELYNQYVHDMNITSIITDEQHGTLDLDEYWKLFMRTVSDNSTIADTEKERLNFQITTEYITVSIFHVE